MRPPAHPDPLTPRSYAVVDVETTGLDARRHRIIEVAVSLVTPEGQVESSWSSLVRPPGDTGPVHVHGITQQDVADAPVFGELTDTLTELLAGRVLVAHNATFDWSFLAHEAARAGAVLPVAERLCTVKLARRLDLPTRDRKLVTLAEHFAVPVTQSHRAAADVATLVAVLQQFLALADRRRIPLPFEECQPAGS